MSHQNNEILFITAHPHYLTMCDEKLGILLFFPYCEKGILYRYTAEMACVILPPTSISQFKQKATFWRSGWNRDTHGTITFQYVSCFLRRKFCSSFRQNIHCCLFCKGSKVWLLHYTMLELHLYTQFTLFKFQFKIFYCILT